MSGQWEKQGSGTQRGVGPGRQQSGMPRDAFGMLGSLPAPARDRRGNQLNSQINSAGQLADSGQAGFGQLGAESGVLRGQLGDIASGKLSQSSEQLRQGLQQNLAAQQSMAASARPANAAMAARTGMMNAGRLGAGLSGQQAMAGIAERQGAMNTLGGMLGQQRGLELQAALGARGQAMGGMQAQLAEEERRRAAEAAQGSGMGGIVGGIAGGALGFGLGGPGGALAGAQVGSGLGKQYG